MANAINAEFLSKEISVAFSKTPIVIDQKESFDYREFTFDTSEMRDLECFSWNYFELKYKALGGEAYVYFGSLTSDNQKGKKNRFRLNEEAMLQNSAYVFLDDFSLAPFFEKEPREISFELVETVDPITILFPFDKALLDTGAVATLDSLASFLMDYDLHILVTGSTDSIGSQSYNLRLGKERAQAVANYLSFVGVPDERLKFVSVGEKTPGYSNHSEEYRRMNRNAIIEFFRKGNSSEESN